MLAAELPRTNPVPLMATVEMLALVFPVLFTVSSFVPDDPTVTFPKLRLVALGVN
jgi:hypothetical protein